MHEVPARAKCAGRTVRDKKESILRKRNDDRKGSSSRWDSWYVLGRKD